MDGSTNARSRGATLVALTETGSFRIGDYVDLTVDWAKTPSGDYYSNKAPGPVLLGFPVYWGLDWIRCQGQPSTTDCHNVRLRQLSGDLRLLSLLLQVVPWLAVAFLWAGLLAEQNTPASGVAIFLGTLLFGNTAAVLMNSYFGHGMTAVAALLTLWAVFKERWLLAGWFFGWAVLCDYAFALFALPFPLLLWNKPKVPGVVLRLFLGGVVPLLVFWLYHRQLFGSGFALPYQFQNPRFVDRAADAVHWWGILGIPSVKTLAELLFGSYRGLLWTQPWVFLVVPQALVASWRMRTWADRVALSVIVGNLLLLVFNASFGGWHGGASPGPRYLSAGVVLLVPLLPRVYELSSPRWRSILLATILVSISVHLAVLYCFEFPKEDQGLWAYLAQTFVEHPGTFALRASLTLPCVIAAVLATWPIRTR